MDVAPGGHGSRLGKKTAQVTPGVALTPVNGASPRRLAAQRGIT